jgi:hypothetical protein
MISSADLKRQILDSAKTGIRKQPKELPEGITEGDILEIGKNLESVTKMAGWAAIEEFMLRRMNLVQMAMQDTSSEVQRGIARGYIELMTYVEKTIAHKNAIQARLNNETKSVPKDQKEQGV